MSEPITVPIPEGDPSSDEYLAAAKAGALRYLDAGDGLSAVIAMAAAMKWRDQHEGRAGGGTDMLIQVGALYLATDPHQLRYWINGWR